MKCPKCDRFMVKNGKGRKGEQRYICKDCSQTQSDRVFNIAIDEELAKEAKLQGLDIQQLSNDAVAAQIDFDMLPYTSESYKEAIAILREHKLDFHYPLARSIAKQLDATFTQAIKENCPLDHIQIVSNKAK